MDSDSYESALSSAESEYAPKKKTAAAKGKKKKVDVPYKAKHSLKAPRATTYTAQSLVDQLHRDEIDLDPEYQRDVVWPDTKQVGLVDSIIRNYYVPPIVFKVNTLDDGTELKTCIDGKQRLTTIERFMSGQIYHRDIFTHKKYYFTEPPKPSGLRLPESYRRAFANKQIVCVEYTDLTEDDEREIFKRVQLGMALTPAERLQSISSPTASLVRTLMETYLTESSLAGPLIDWEQTRGSDFRCTAQVVYNIARYPAAKNLGTVTQLEAWLDGAEPVPPALHARADAAFRIFSNLVNDAELRKVALASVQGVGKSGAAGKIAPVEFIAIGALVAAHKDALSAEELARAIGDMRRAVRAKNKDIRLNDTIGKQYVEWIKALKAGKGRRGVSAAVSLGGWEEKGKKERGGKEEEAPSAKRKRKESESDEEDPPPATASAKRPSTASRAGLSTAPPKGKSMAPKASKPTPPPARIKTATTQPPAQPTPPPPPAAARPPTRSPSSAAASLPPIAALGFIPSGGASSASATQANGVPPRPGSHPSMPHMANMAGIPLAASLMSMGEPAAPPLGPVPPGPVPMGQMPMGQMPMGQMPGIQGMPGMQGMPGIQGMPGMQGIPFPPWHPNGLPPPVFAQGMHFPPNPFAPPPGQGAPPGQGGGYPPGQGHGQQGGVQVKQEQRDGPILSAPPKASGPPPSAYSQRTQGHGRTTSDGGSGGGAGRAEWNRPREYEREYGYDGREAQRDGHGYDGRESHAREYPREHARDQGREYDGRDARRRPPSYAGSGGGYRKDSTGSRGYESRWDAPRR